MQPKFKYNLRTINFNPDGSAAIEYVIPAEDVRGGLIRNHVIYVPADPNYADEVEAVWDAAIELLDDVLEDLELIPAPSTDVQTKEEDDD